MFKKQLLSKLTMIFTIIIAIVGVVLFFVCIRTRSLDQLALSLAFLFCAIIPSAIKRFETTYTYIKALFAVLYVAGVACVFIGWRINFLVLSGVGVVLVAVAFLLAYFIKDPSKVDAWKTYFDTLD